jgi:hypothetical protein
MRFLISLFLIYSSFILISQDSIFIRKKFQNNQSSALKILGSWSTLNLIVSPIYLTHIKNRGGASSSAEYFNKMNFNWNLVNGGICLAGTFKSKTLKNKSWNNKEVTNSIIKLKKTLFINMGLDISYLLAGVILKKVAPNNSLRRHQYTGFGNSLITQGGFLFVFDCLFLKSISNLVK